LQAGVTGSIPVTSTKFFTDIFAEVYIIWLVVTASAIF